MTSGRGVQEADSEKMSARIGPETALPYTSDFGSTEEYVNSLLDFVGSDETLRTLCGGVHILDFFTSEPSLYDRVLPQDWRDFFARHDPMSIVDVLLRKELPTRDETTVPGDGKGKELPSSLLSYIHSVRSHLLRREPGGSQCSRNRQVKQVQQQQQLARHVTVGMNVKKVHEVGLFASYLDHLTTSITDLTHEPITHLVDFGSGQNYLGRALASEPYNRNIVAVESRQANAERAKEFDVMAKLAVKQKIMRDKKAFRNGFDPVPATRTPVVPATLPTRPPEHNSGRVECAPEVELATAGKGKIQYIEHRITDGDLTDVIERMPGTATEQKLMVMSLHSCGNLVHHGLRSLVLNPQVRCVAMVGCCYNLVTERLGPATYKLPQLRPTTFDHSRLKRLGEARDPHGFPMSKRFCDYYDTTNPTNPSNTDKGVRLNITSRMMAVQAPSNWGPKDSESFFTRHFYRALLQRIFLDRGVVGPPTPNCVGGVSPAGHSSGGTPIVIGSLRKGCYENFVTYVRGALAKLTQDPDHGALFQQKMGDITDEEIGRYAEEWKEGKKKLSIIWSLMAFSAGVMEAAIVVDRWLWLKEQEQVKEAWVEPVFDYKFSPRNLVVVGVKG